MADHQQAAAVKVQQFRQYTNARFAQAAEELCQEFEREVNILTEDLVLCRTELARCADLLASQLGREKELHKMLATIAGNTGSLVASAADIGQRHGASESVKVQMHEMVEQLFGHSQSLVQTAIGGVNDHHSIAHTHLLQAKELENKSLSAENELNRILAILRDPTIAGLNATGGSSMLSAPLPPTSASIYQQMPMEPVAGSPGSGIQSPNRFANQGQLLSQSQGQGRPTTMYTSPAPLVGTMGATNIGSPVRTGLMSPQNRTFGGGQSYA
eukprot:TRINITY_DN111642_c0_g1_i1.p1 TRINITY_DN111642_c0_g1~~TRINITY_DN111642_c0_g1_i1.p1  ORF type:complete len:271 (-),score=54.85 TRINITY_DN111642_c0_g1_i1:107-919(-)